jgi:glycosyltransferase involved in cell wall biosynthesis
MQEEKKKVLIIAYYWPPSGGSGVQRWLKFVKYLPKFGWTPYVFTPENPSFAVKDESLLKDVPSEAEIIHFPIWEPYDLFFKVSSWFGEKKGENKPTALVSSGKKGFFHSLSTWMRGNFLIPDPRRFWVKPSVQFLKDFLRDNKIDIIITTGPPHSIHLIGLKLKQAMPGLKWIADFRDPWSQWGFLDTLMVSGAVRKYHERLERSVLNNADEVMTITPFYVRQFERLGNRKVQLFTNGFDEDDFASLSYSKSENFLIRHIGVINEKCDPRPFLVALDEVINDSPAFRDAVELEFIGDVHPQIRAFIKASETLNQICRLSGNMPHKKLIGLYGASSLLLLVLTGYKDAEGYMPGKLFEYLATGIPVLGVGPEDGDASTLLKQSGLGKMIDGSAKAEIKSTLLQHFQEWKNSSAPEINRSAAEQYSRRAITGNLAELLATLHYKESPSPKL